jgi:DNA polymerase III subunit alpha
VRDVARVQGKPYGLADRIAKLIPFEVGISLEKAVSDVPELAQLIRDSEEVSEITDMAFKLEGIVRNVGRHAGGVVIAPGRLSGFVPLYTDDSGVGLVSQFDKDDVERAGLVKFDFLGLKTLTIIDWAVAAVNRDREQRQESPIDIDSLGADALGADDEATFELLKRAETTAVFQLESRGMKDLIRRLQPDRFEDIVALVALFRPGPLQSGMVDDFIDRKHGKAMVEYPHPSLESVLSNTYGVILYQEQVMQIAQVLAGFTLGQADLLRRAMGKKKPEEMAALRDRFSRGAVAQGVDRDLAAHIFDLMEKFAGYGFNKSHSAAYAIVSYQTAWLKAHYPAQYMAAVLSADMHLTDKVVALVDEVRRMGIPLDPPDVNASEYRFTTHEGRILYGLGAIKGVGEGAVQTIVAARGQGRFRDLEDFCLRVDPRRANRRFIESLIRAGAMDSFAVAHESVDAVRARLLAALPDALQSAEQVTRDLQSGMTDLFGGALAAPVESADAPRAPRRIVPLRRRERLEGEKETLGLYLTGHPIDDYLEEIRHFCPTKIVDLRTGRGTVAGLVVSTRTMRTRRGDAAFTILDDRSDRIEISVFSEVFEMNKSKISKDAVLIIEGNVQPDEFTQSHKMIADRVSTMDEARARYADRLEIQLHENNAPTDLIVRLRRALEPHRTNGCPVSIMYERGDAVGRLQLGDGWRVAPTDELLTKLRTAFGTEQVRVAYRRA